MLLANDTYAGTPWCRQRCRDKIGWARPRRAGLTSTDDAFEVIRKALSCLSLLFPRTDKYSEVIHSTHMYNAPIKFDTCFRVVLKMQFLKVYFLLKNYSINFSSDFL